MPFELSDWVALSEIFGGLAIVVSLIFVGMQIRSNTRATHAATFQEHMGYEIDFVVRVGSDPSLARIWETAQKDFGSLEGDEKIQGTYLFLGAMRLWEGYYMQWRAGTLSNDAWRAREPLVRSFAMLSMPAFGGASPDGEIFSGPFAKYLQQVQKEQAVTSP
ncbi:MAG: hypothetical protein PVF50_00460 [Gammaproteobacteria bacterium]